ncbi:MAG: hypothetical protein JW867_07190, partial [Candidatus Omnitrophica bacterium]|nr:hypothetical protein [Candidatus Omnitrophota bacterium]
LTWAFNFYNPRYRIELAEDSSFFNIGGIIIVLLTIFSFTAGAVKIFFKKIKFDNKYLVFSFLFLVYLSAMSFFLKWDYWQSRYMITLMLISMPLFTLIFNSEGKLLKGLGKAIIIYSIIFLVPATFTIINKSFVSLNQDKLSLVCQNYTLTLNPIRRFEFFVPKDSKVGIIVTPPFWDYKLFGDKLTRTIIPVNQKIILEQDFDYIVAEAYVFRFLPELKKLVDKDYFIISELRKKKFYECYLYAPRVKKNN